MKIGVIGGSGVDDPKIFDSVETIKMHTPYGMTSGFLNIGKINGKDVVTISRHGDKHSYSPSNVNFRANLWALKELGVTHVIAASAVGSLRDDMVPGDFVFVDQFIDRTTNREQSFYCGREVCHISMAEPFCSKLRLLLKASALSLGLRFHGKGTIVVIEGPRFSTRAESNLFRSWGCDVIGMTLVPECVLARELGMCYAAVSMVTDYDCWKEEIVDASKVIEVMKKNSSNVNKMILDVINRIDYNECSCNEAFKNSIM